MNFDATLKFNKFLDELGKVLDITPTQFEQAKSSYEAVGKWLARDDSPIAKYNPVIYPQGSFRIGTVIKPLANDDNFDVDVVCLLKDLPSQISQKDLKEMVGNALKSNDVYASMLTSEGRRCWTLQYADDRKFHVDILPSTNDDFQWLLDAGLDYNRAQHAIKLTDKTCPGFENSGNQEWPKSNPRGYSDWFNEQMSQQFEEIKKFLAAFRKSEIESINDFEVRTPLQRAVQILKRHRDVMFGDDPDRPISIIITTLAARAYGNESNLHDALVNLLDEMPRHIHGEKGQRVVSNPVNPKENFADKWEKSPEREENFYSWLTKAKEDFVGVFNAKGLGEELFDNLRESVGENLVNEALRRGNLENLVEHKSSYRDLFRSLFRAPHKAKPRWDLELTGSVNISASYKDSRGSHTLISKESLPKNASIHFIGRTNVEKPFSVYWQVVNTGDEADRVEGGLRGGIFPAKSAGKGGLRHTEKTLYRGTHWIECFIVKGNTCVARSNEFIVKID